MRSCVNGIRRQKKKASFPSATDRRLLSFASLQELSIDGKESEWHGSAGEHTLTLAFPGKEVRVKVALEL